MPLVLALSPVVSNLLMLFFVAVAVVMILVILIQRPQGGGLSGAFGASSGGSGQTAFGAKTGDALTLMTIGTFVVFILTAILLVFTSRPPATLPQPATAAPAGQQMPAETQPDAGQPADEPGASEPETAEPESSEPVEQTEDPADTAAQDPPAEPGGDPEPGS